MISEVKLRVPVTSADHAQGPKDAPLVLLKYGDYQCPYCGQAYYIVKQLQQTLPDDLRFVFRNFPLSQIHPDAVGAARAAEAAALQRKFWEMHDTLYENQDSLDPESLLEYAAELGLDLSKFIADMGSKQVERRIVEDFQGGVRSGVNGTPTFFVNGFRYDGDWRYPSLLNTLKAALAQLPMR
jgi:protein-disulfide isomerase